jgi:GTP:adenosylcobinamide-phosphate guanylyltransferase
MKGVVMAGGRASRFAAKTEKGILVVGGRTLLERAADALRVRGLDGVVVAVSKNAPRTTALAGELGIAAVDTGGMGYHEDTATLIGMFGSFVSLNVDVAFARRTHVEELVSKGHDGSAAVVVPTSLAIRAWDPASVMTDESGESLLWVGLNIVTRKPTTSLLRITDPLLSVNVNDEDDLAFADSLAIERGL